jgi:HD-like signal output (HDOD) protein
VSYQRAKEIVDGIEDLPTLPEVVIEITRLVENPDTTAEDVYKIVSTDIALSATMLKLVNSAFYGMRRSITSLEKAIRILGFTTVRNIALAAFVFDAFLTGRGQVDYKGFWIHSIGVGTAAGVLAKKKSADDVSEYFVYGLLHDLGVVVYMQYLPVEYAKVKELAAQGTPLEEAEIQVVGCTHGEIGRASCRERV